MNRRLFTEEQLERVKKGIALYEKLGDRLFDLPDLPREGEPEAVPPPKSKHETGRRPRYCEHGHEQTGVTSYQSVHGKRCRECLEEGRYPNTGPWLKKIREGEAQGASGTCRNGHALTPETIYHDGGALRCRECQREGVRRWRAKQKREGRAA